MQKYIKTENLTTVLQHDADWAKAQFPTYQSVMTLQSGHRLSILSTSTKTNKGAEFIIALLFLSPYRAVQGINNCPFAGVCPATCLDQTGMLPFHVERRTRLTLALYLFPEEFITELLMEIAFLGFKAMQQGKECWIRLNGTSDIKWEELIHMEAFKNDQLGIGGFYDYTKYPFGTRVVPNCYKLTFSIDEKSNSAEQAVKYLQNGQAAAIVLNAKDYKSAIQDYAFVDGDKDDYRFRDTGIVVLQAKRLFKGRKYRGKTIIQHLDKAVEVLENVKAATISIAKVI